MCNNTQNQTQRKATAKYSDICKHRAEFIKAQRVKAESLANLHLVASAGLSSQGMPKRAENATRRN